MTFNPYLTGAPESLIRQGRGGANSPQEKIATKKIPRDFKVTRADAYRAKA